MLPHFRYKRRSVPALLNEYSLLNDKTKTAKEFYMAVPLSERQVRLDAFDKWLKLFCETNGYMIEFISYYSPDMAKNLKAQLKGYAKRQQKLLTEKYWDSPALKSLSDKRLDEHMKAMLDNAMKFGNIHEKEIKIAFVVVVDTLKRVSGELPSGTEDKIMRSLAYHKPELAKIYEGALKALESDNPDRYRHCSTSMRQIIDKTFGGDASERRSFLKAHTQSAKEMQILEALAHLVKSIDETWNKGVHEEIQSEIALLALQATELLIAYIYPSKKKKN